MGHRILVSWDLVGAGSGFFGIGELEQGLDNKYLIE